MNKSSWAPLMSSLGFVILDLLLYPQIDVFPWGGVTRVILEFLPSVIDNLSMPFIPRYRNSHIPCLYP